MSHSETLFKAVESVLEQAAFVSVTGIVSKGFLSDGLSDCTKTLLDPTEEAVTAVIESTDGMLVLWIPFELAGLMAENMLGSDLGPDARSKACDAVCEAANMIAGLVFVPKEGSRDWRICLPKLWEPGPLIDFVGANNIEAVGCVDLLVEDCRFAAILYKAGKGVKPT